jgi:hypothetical protein
MSNRETFPSSLFPLRGDLSAEAGNVIVEVIGLQRIPIAPNPLTDGAVPTYVAANADIEWLISGDEKAAILINGVGVSDDYLVLVDTALTINYGSDNFLGVRINGVRDGG